MVSISKIEGPISPADLVEIPHRMFKEQGKAFGKNEEKMRARAKEEGKIRAYHRESEEQDAAYLAALQIDKVSFIVLLTN